jgi:polysaccharide deacetylase family protein (PEP-CTERM system associated)
VTTPHVIHALTFDMEEWYHRTDFPTSGDPRKWKQMHSLVEQHTGRVLELLDRLGARATFFVVGWVASRHPHLVRTIADLGHEVASHGYWHRPPDTMTPQQFRADLRRSISTLEDRTGKPVLGYRAPGFRLTPKQAWAFDVMLDSGLKYDASVVPTRWKRSGVRCPPYPHRFGAAPTGRTILELPMTARQWGPIVVKTGGGFLRVLPMNVIQSVMRSMQKNGLPVVLQLRPHDLATDAPRQPVTMRQHLQHYAGLMTAERKFRALLRQFRFDSCAAVLGLTAPRPTSSMPQKRMAVTPWNAMPV